MTVGQIILVISIVILIPLILIIVAKSLERKFKVQTTNEEVKAGPQMSHAQQQQTLREERLRPAKELCESQKSALRNQDLRIIFAD